MVPKQLKQKLCCMLNPCGVCHHCGKVVCKHHALENKGSYTICLSPKCNGNSDERELYKIWPARPLPLTEEEKKRRPGYHLLEKIHKRHPHKNTKRKLV